MIYKGCNFSINLKISIFGGRGVLYVCILYWRKLWGTREEDIYSPRTLLEIWVSCSSWLHLSTKFFFCNYHENQLKQLFGMFFLKNKLFSINLKKFLYIIFLHKYICQGSNRRVRVCLRVCYPYILRLKYLIRCFCVED